MLGKFSGLSPRMKLIAGSSTALVVVLAGVALAVGLTGSGSPSISDNEPCGVFVNGEPGEQSSYLASKLKGVNGEAPSSREEVAYREGIQINCSKGYPNSTTIREFEATRSEIAEAEAEGADLSEAIALIRQRSDERETYGEFVEEVEGP